VLALPKFQAVSPCLIYLDLFEVTRTLLVPLDIMQELGFVQVAS